MTPHVSLNPYMFSYVAYANSNLAVVRFHDSIVYENSGHIPDTYTRLITIRIQYIDVYNLNLCNHSWLGSCCIHAIGGGATYAS